MKKFTGRLWTRLLAAQLLIIALGAVTLIVLVELLAPTFFSNDLRTMNSMMADPSHMGDMMGDMMTGSSSTGLFTPTVQADLEASFDSSFRRALIGSASCRERMYYCEVKVVWVKKSLPVSFMRWARGESNPWSASIVQR